MGRCEPTHAVRWPTLHSDGAPVCSAPGSLSMQAVLLLCNVRSRLAHQLKAAYARGLSKKSQPGSDRSCLQHASQCVSLVRVLTHAFLVHLCIMHHGAALHHDDLLKLHAACSGTGGGGKPLPGISCGGQPRVYSRTALPFVACRLMCLSAETIQQHRCNLVTAQALQMRLALLPICWQNIPCIILQAAD